MRNSLVALALLTLAALAHGAGAVAEPKKARSQERPPFTLQDSGCGGEGHLADVQCLGRYLRWLDAELNRAYASALKNLPVRDPTDDRKSQEQLRKSQRAWTRYKTENCVLVGAQEGGSNLSVTDFAAQCEEREIKDRIKFLRAIAE